MSATGMSLAGLQSLADPVPQTGTLSRLDPRALLLATLAFLLAVLSFDRYRVLALLPFAMFPVAVAAIGQVPLKVIAPKLLLAAPFALMVGIFNPWFDRAPMLELAGLSISAGWVSFSSIMIRFVLTVSAALVLVHGIGFHQICLGLRRIGLPPAFTTQLHLLLRYANVVGGEAARMLAAHALRAPAARRLALPVYGKLLGHLLLRALSRAERVHLAMVSRGFDGSLRSAQDRPWKRADSIFLLLCLSGFALARWVDLPQALGLGLLRLLA